MHDYNSRFRSFSFPCISPTQWMKKHEKLSIALVSSSKSFPFRRLVMRKLKSYLHEWAPFPFFLLNVWNAPHWKDVERLFSSSHLLSILLNLPGAKTININIRFKAFIANWDFSRSLAKTWLILCFQNYNLYSGWYFICCCCIWRVDV